VSGSVISTLIRAVRKKFKERETMSFRKTAAAKVAMLTVFAATLSLGSTAFAGDAAQGKIDFTQKFGCFQCHGTWGQGGAAGARLAPNPLPYEALSNFVRTTNGAMPPFTKEVLTDQQLEDIYAYLESIPKSPAAKDIPILNN
jgi:mono/diheme cytochrome c family protein